jgi:outer membrane protein assembly complex protein YaeT
VRTAEGAIRATTWILALWLGGVAAQAQSPAPIPSGPALPTNRPAQTAADSAPQFEDRRVAGIRVVSESGEVLEENPSGLAQRSGQPYNSAAVRESLRQLYRRGRYADIRAEAVPAKDEVRLDFVVRQNFFVNNVRVRGLHEPPNEGAALAALGLGLGEAFRESDVPERMERLVDALRNDGFYAVGADLQLAENEATRQIDLTFQVSTGPRARIGAVAMQGEKESTDGELLKRSKLRPGARITGMRLERAANRIRKILAKRGHLGARVTIRRGGYDKEKNTLPLTVEVFTGPKVRVELSGAKISKEKLRKLLPIYEEGAVDEDLLQEGRRNIRDYLESQGYFDSQVGYATSTDPKTGQQLLTYEVQRGSQRRLAGIAFEGNKYFHLSLLRERVRLQPAGTIFHGRFSRKMMEDDAESIRGLYVANGYRDAKVQPELIENYQGKEGNLYVRFRVEEGPQTLVDTLKLEGNQAFSNSFLMSNIGSTPDQPFSDFNVADDRNNILALYYNEGFPDARFEAEAVNAEKPNRMNLTYRITEGPQYTVKQVLISGQETTRENVIAREVQVKAGEPLRQGNLVETQRRLYDLGIFSRAQIAPQNPSGTDAEKTLVVLVEEGKRYTIAYGGGVEVQRLGSGSDPTSSEVKASPRGIFEFTRANFLGRAHTVSFKGRASTLQGRALVSYTAPNFLGRPKLSFSLIGFADKTRDVRTFTSTRYEGSVQVAQHYSNSASLQYRFTYRRVQVDASTLKVNPLQIPLFSQPTLISSLGISWVREKRDNPADATRGNFTTTDFSVASRALGSSASFLRAFVQNSTFHPLRGGIVFARSTRMGIQRALGRTRPDDIPLPERFFAGGGNSLRGFALNQAGRRDGVTGFPIGGLAMLVFNQELRFPMRLPFVKGPVGGAVFYDAGNVFSRANRITLRGSPSAADVKSGDLNYLSHTIGLGLRYATPIGPVRLDLGYLLNPAHIEFCVTTAAPDPLRCPAGQGIQRARLPQFHFYFNIGSLF